MFDLRGPEPDTEQLCGGLPENLLGGEEMVGGEIVWASVTRPCGKTSAQALQQAAKSSRRSEREGWAGCAFKPLVIEGLWVSMGAFSGSDASQFASR